MSTTDTRNDLISVARIARPQGLRGEVIADILTDFPDRFELLDEISLRLDSGVMVSDRLQHARAHKGRIVLKFEGYNSANEAEGLRGASVMIPREELLPLPVDTYYDFDLVDCEVVTREGETLGKVVGVHHFGAAPLLEVTCSSGETGDPEAQPAESRQREVLIPLASSICVEVDVERKRIVVELPEGLLEAAG